MAKPLPGPALHITWKDNSDNEDGFVLERKMAGGEFTVLTMKTFGADVHHDANVTFNTTYTYRIAAVNATGKSAYSAEVTATATVM